MKKLFLVILALVVCASYAYAADDFPGSRLGTVALNSATIIQDENTDYGHTHVCTSPAYVYRVTYTASVANTTVNLFDSAVSGAYNSDEVMVKALSATAKGGSKIIKADLPVATANTMYQVTYDPPLRFEYGVLAGFGDTGAGAAQNGMNAVATIEYRQN